MRVNPKVRRWLTGRDSDPSVRWKFLTEVEGRPGNDPTVRAARREVGRTGWAAELMTHQLPAGQWVTPGSSDEEIYRPKYVATNWRAIALAELGATRSDRRVRRAAELILRRWSDKRTDLLGGRISEICVTGNAARMLLRFGYADHPLVRRSLDWVVRSQKADGGWFCFRSRRGSLDCWEGLAALAEVPTSQRSPAMRRCIERGAEFYLSRELMHEGPVAYPPWFRIHWPNHYYYDLLVGLRVLTRLGYGADRRLRPALRWLERKRSADGRWSIDADHPDNDADRGGYVWGEGPVWPMRFEAPGLPSRWVTTEALAVLQRVESARTA